MIDSDRKERGEVMTVNRYLYFYNEYGLFVAALEITPFALCMARAVERAFGWSVRGVIDLFAPKYD